MNIDEAFYYIKNERHNFVHISGKTSTGKSTFACRLKQDLGYEVIELDKVVRDAVITPLHLSNEGLVFEEVYKKRSKPEWIKLFVSRAQEMLQKHNNNGIRVIIDGAIANTVTLRELLTPFPDIKIVYLHPHSLGTYQEYLTNRFMLAGESNNAGLPLAFWELIKKSDFHQFCQDRLITPALSDAIQAYALSSQQASKKRLEDLQNNFQNVSVVEV